MNHPAFSIGSGRGGWVAALRWIGIASLFALALNAAEAPANEPHWAFLPISRPSIPALEAASEVVNPVDAFIQARLSQSALKPSAEADRGTLIRRLYLVMLGVPPTPEEVSAFVSDTRPQAFEHQVDRVLEDPR